MVMNREDIYNMFEDKDISYVFNRVKFDTTKSKAKDTVVVRGSLLEEDLGITNMDGLMLEMLIGDEYISFYQNLISLSYDKRSQEAKLYAFSVSLYKWVSKRLGYIPDWILPDREEHLTQILNLLLVEADDVITDSEVLLALLLRNTNFSNNKIFKEQLRLGVWSATEKATEDLEIAEDEYLQGKTYTSVDSLSLYIRLAERGHLDKDTLDRYMSHKTFKDTVITDYDKVCEALNNFMWEYAGGEQWRGFVGEVYGYLQQVTFNNIEIERVNPNQIVFRDPLEDATVQITFSDKIVVNVRHDSIITVVYNQDYYTTTFERILHVLDRYTFRAKNIIPLVRVLINNMPISIPNKARDIRSYL